MPQPKKRLRPTLSQQRGFTLIELLVVIVILSLLAVFVAPNVLRNVDEAEVETTKNQVASFKETCKIFILKHRRIPENWEELYQSVDGKPALLDLEEDPTDAWGNVYELREHPEKTKQVLIVSAGPDGEFDTEDDITSDNFRKYKLPDAGDQ
ncbi:MAG: type II secretion system protein GspG [Planctomycetota bacterium]|nr:MAG: type II secretion system protein GspG [Planctomycetota bacterium]